MTNDCVVLVSPRELRKGNGQLGTQVGLSTA